MGNWQHPVVDAVQEGLLLEAKNLLFILSDEHQRDITGCYGDTVVRTPHMDRLAARGVRFANAYTPCPICVPARASLATGRWVHQVRAWDNAAPYHGEVASWHHRLREAGHTVTSIGKLHFRSTDDDNGFCEEILPLHVLDGKGDLIGALRDPPPRRGSMPAFAASAGPGESHYNRYDLDIADAACRWLSQVATRAGGKPWTLFVSFVRPHFPLTAPPEFFALYDPDTMPLPRLYDEEGRVRHPAVKALRAIMDYDDYFEDHDRVRLAIASYYALVSFLDDNIGKVLAALDAAGLTDSTRVIYTSDHGENLGCRGLWGKSVMYEESAAVPFIAAGPDLPAGQVVDTPVSLVDCYRSILEAVGCAVLPEDEALPSRSLWAIAAGERPERNVLSEYHAAASVTGSFMIRHGRWKYIHHVGFPPELFDLEADPGETRDLAGEPGMEAVLAECEERLRAICDPDAVNAQAFEDQRRLIAAYGGREAVIGRGDYSYTPAPGEKPVLVVSS
jgi:choline-sulfatase